MNIRLVAKHQPFFFDGARNFFIGFFKPQTGKFWHLIGELSVFVDRVEHRDVILLPCIVIIRTKSGSSMYNTGTIVGSNVICSNYFPRFRWIDFTLSVIKNWLVGTSQQTLARILFNQFGFVTKYVSDSVFSNDILLILKSDFCISQFWVDGQRHIRNGGPWRGCPC